MLPSMTVQNVVRLHTLDTMTIAGIAHYRETYSWYEILALISRILRLCASALQERPILLLPRLGTIFLT